MFPESDGNDVCLMCHGHREKPSKDGWLVNFIADGLLLG